MRQTVGLIFCAFVATSGIALAEDDASALLQAGTAAPSFSLPTLTGTREVLSVYCGEKLSKPYVNSIHHVVILSFWATYCKPCQKEIPELMKFATKHQNDSVKIFCISIDKEGADIVAPLVNEKKYSIPVLLDPYKTTASRYGVKSLPSLFVIGPNGVIRFASTGFDEKSNLEVKLEGILNGIRQGSTIAVKQEVNADQGESVPVKQDTPAISPKQKWHAVARVECGETPEKVADEMNLSADEVKAWYAQLKSSAMSVWGEKK